MAGRPTKRARELARIERIGEHGEIAARALAACSRALDAGDTAAAKSAYDIAARAEATISTIQERLWRREDRDRGVDSTGHVTFSFRQPPTAEE